jgi:hypothetical protein
MLGEPSTDARTADWIQSVLEQLRKPYTKARQNQRAPHNTDYRAAALRRCVRFSRQLRKWNNRARVVARFVLVAPQQSAF